jgi:D-serine deaminase-like pyridoxal phosphate-dependent protein
MTNRFAATAELPTPALVLHGAIVERNIRQMSQYAAEHNLNVRPHVKMHKSRALWRMQREAGAIGLAVARVGEAEAIADPGDDVLLAFPPVDPARVRALARLGQRMTVRAAVDSHEAAHQIGEAAHAENSTIGLLVDLDVGMHRTGVGSSDNALALAKAIDQTDNLRLDGLMIYPGFVWDPSDQQPAILQRIDARIQETLEKWREHGLSAEIVSGASTATAYLSHHVTAMNEIRAGMYVFNDMCIVGRGYCTLDDCAATVLVTVVSDRQPGQVVVDAGSKVLTTDPNVPAPNSGYGYVLEYPQARINRLSEEHGQIDVTGCDKQPRVGDRLTLIPNHICPCINLRETVWWVSGDGALSQLKIDGRGVLT